MAPPPPQAAFDGITADSDDDSSKRDKLAARAARFTQKLPGNRYKELEEARSRERAGYEAQGLIRLGQTELDDAVDLKGTCERMCSDYEREFREWTREVNPFERLQGQAGRIDPNKAVAAYTRSDAGAGHGNAAILPSDLRTPAALVRSLDYLMGEVMPLSASGVDSPSQRKSLGFSAGFIRDRSRAIRKEFAMQSSWGHGEAIATFERIARWHILCLRELQEESGTNTDLHIDSAELGRCFTSLRQLYNDRRETTGEELASPHEPEFTAYMLIFNLSQKSVSIPLAELPPSIIDSPIVRTAWDLRNAAQRNFDSQKEGSKGNAELGLNSIGRYVALLKSPKVPFLLACMAEIRLREMRRSALRALVRTYGRIRGDVIRTNEQGEVVERKMMMLETLAPLLGCEEQEDEETAWDDVLETSSLPTDEAIGICKRFGIELYPPQGQPVGALINMQTPFNDNRDAPFTRRWKLITDKRGDVPFKDIVNGDVETRPDGSLVSLSPDAISAASAARSRKISKSSLNPSAPSFSFGGPSKPPTASSSFPTLTKTLSQSAFSGFPSSPAPPAASVGTTKPAFSFGLPTTTTPASSTPAPAPTSIEPTPPSFFDSFKRKTSPPKESPSLLSRLSKPIASAPQSESAKTPPTFSFAPPPTSTQPPETAPTPKAPPPFSFGLTQTPAKPSVPPIETATTTPKAPPPVSSSAAAPAAPPSFFPTATPPVAGPSKAVDFTLPPLASTPQPPPKLASPPPSASPLSRSTTAATPFSPNARKKSLAVSRSQRLASFTSSSPSATRDAIRHKQRIAIPHLADELMSTIITELISSLTPDLERYVHQSSAARAFSSRKRERRLRIEALAPSLLDSMVDELLQPITDQAFRLERVRREKLAKARMQREATEDAQFDFRQIASRDRELMRGALSHLGGTGAGAGREGSVKGSIRSHASGRMDEWEMDIALLEAQRSTELYHAKGTFLDVVAKHVAALLKPDAPDFFRPEDHPPHPHSHRDGDDESPVFGVMLSTGGGEGAKWLARKFSTSGPEHVYDGVEFDVQVVGSNESGEAGEVGLMVLVITDDLTHARSRLESLRAIANSPHNCFFPSLLLVTWDKTPIQHILDALYLDHHAQPWNDHIGLLSLAEPHDLDSKLSAVIKRILPTVRHKPQVSLDLGALANRLSNIWDQLVQTIVISLARQPTNATLAITAWKEGIDVINLITHLIQESIEGYDIDRSSTFTKLFFPDFLAPAMDDMSLADVCLRIDEYLSTGVFSGVAEVHLLAVTMGGCLSTGQRMLSALCNLVLTELGSHSLHLLLWYPMKEATEWENRLLRGIVEEYGAEVGEAIEVITSIIPPTSIPSHITAGPAVVAQAANGTTTSGTGLTDRLSPRPKRTLKRQRSIADENASPSPSPIDGRTPDKGKGRERESKAVKNARLLKAMADAARTLSEMGLDNSLDEIVV